MSETATIEISRATLNELRAIGEDYNAVIEKLIRDHKEHEYRLRIDRLAKEADDFIKEHRDEFVDIDDL